MIMWSKTMGMFFVCLALVALPSAATPARLWNFDRSGVDFALASAEARYGSFFSQEGEILAVDGEELVFSQAGRETNHVIPRGIQVFVNGYPGFPHALRPVAPGSFFQGRLHFDAEGTLRLVEGWYLGGEV